MNKELIETTGVAVLATAVIVLAAWWSNDWTGTATVIAVFVSPILAVIVTRYIDGQRAKDQRRWDLFRTLMRSRRSVLSPDFVGALNLVEVEFAGDDAVVGAWKGLLAGYNNPPPATSPDELRRAFEQLDDLRAKLLDAMSKALHLGIEQIDIYRGGYAPKAWADVEDEQRMLRAYFKELFEGRRALPVNLVQPSGPANDAGRGG